MELSSRQAMETPTFDSLEIGLDSMLASVLEGEILLWKGNGLLDSRAL